MNSTLTCWFDYNDGRLPSIRKPCQPGDEFSDLLDELNRDHTIKHLNVILLDGRQGTFYRKTKQ